MIFLLSMVIFISEIAYSQSFVPATNINFKVSPTIDYIGNNVFRYSYKVESKNISVQDIWLFAVKYKTSISLNSPPQGWSGTNILQGEKFAYWAADGGTPQTVQGKEHFIKPGTSLNGFSFTSSALPISTQFRVQGNAPLPDLSDTDGFTKQQLLQYEEQLKFFNNSISGNTIGPGSQNPGTFSNEALINYLISQKHLAISEGWITNQGIINSLDKKLDNALKALRQGKNNTAKNIINAFINELNAQNSKHISVEAYALLKSVADYLISRL